MNKMNTLLLVPHIKEEKDSDDKKKCPGSVCRDEKHYDTTYILLVPVRYIKISTQWSRQGTRYRYDQEKVQASDGLFGLGEHFEILQEEHSYLPKILCPFERMMGAIR